jgi:hypothetical protein
MHAEANHNRDRRGTPGACQAGAWVSYHPGDRGRGPTARRQHLESEHEERAARQRRYLTALSTRTDVAVLASEEMWR